MKIACIILFIIWGILSVLGQNNVFIGPRKKFFISVYISTGILLMATLLLTIQGGVR